jgi:hypothetical protein
MVNLTKHGHSIWSIWLNHGHFDKQLKKIVRFDYNLTLGQNGYFNFKNQPKKPCVIHG